MKRSAPAEGFSLIELIIVIALGGFILSLVFLGVVQGQRNNRDDVRRAAVGRYLLAAKQWSSENDGALINGAVDARSVVYQYIINGGGSYNPPNSSSVWVVKYQAGVVPPAPSAGVILVFAPGSCNADGSIQDQSASPTGQDSRQLAASTTLEDGHVYCAVQ